jgi:hypothetical protein
MNFVVIFNWTELFKDNKGQPGWAPPPAQAPPYSPPGQPGWAQPPPGPNYGQPAHYGTGGAVVIQQVFHLFSILLNTTLPLLSLLQ